MNNIKANVVMLAIEQLKAREGQIYKSITGGTPFLIERKYHGNKAFEVDNHAKEHGLIAQHLYLTVPYDTANSLTHIKEGDWYIDDSSLVRKAIMRNKSYWVKRLEYSKITATTYPSLDLPIIPSAWIQDVFIPSNGEIKEVNIETETHDRVRFNGKAGTTYWYRHLTDQKMIVKDLHQNWYGAPDGGQIFKRDVDFIEKVTAVKTHTHDNDYVDYYGRVKNNKKGECIITAVKTSWDREEVEQLLIKACNGLTDSSKYHSKYAIGILDGSL